MAYANLAVAYHRKKLWKKALDCFIKAEELNQQLKYHQEMQKLKTECKNNIND